MKRSSLLLLTALTMLAFAANSVLCRLALRSTQVDPASFTAVRLACAALVLWLIVRVRRTKAAGGGSWLSAAALFVYAAAFSFAYTGLPAGIGALILFGAVQATMVGHGLWRGERLGLYQALGMASAIAGLVALLLPHGAVAAPPLSSSALMLAAGAAWGMYSLRGRGAQDATAATQGNFARTLPMVAVLVLASVPMLRFDAAGLLLAATSGSLASGPGLHPLVHRHGPAARHAGRDRAAVGAADRHRSGRAADGRNHVSHTAARRRRHHRRHLAVAGERPPRPGAGRALMATPGAGAAPR